MKAYCGTDCEKCQFKDSCKGCENTCGRPFGGRCIAAEIITIGGMGKYVEFTKNLLCEINGLLTSLDLPCASALYELKGDYVNLVYTLPSGEKVKFLNDNDIYLGTQIEVDGMERCIGVVAGFGFVLICSYGENGSEPELICYKRR